MIVDALSRSCLYFGLNSKLCTALQYLETLDVQEIPVGKHEILGEEIFAVVSEYETHSQGEGMWEAHRDYIDIQYIAKGVETIGYCDVNDLQVVEEYNPAKDIVFGNAQGDFITLREGSFMLLFPHDAHKPGNTHSETSWVKKVVVKVRVF